MNTSRDQLSQERKDEMSEGNLDFLSRGDVEELNLWRDLNSSSHVHYKLKLEGTVANQNSLIESLKESLEFEKSKNDNLTKELYATKEDARDEIKILNAKMEEMLSESKCREAEITREHLEKLFIFKEDLEKQLEEKYTSNIAALEEQLRIMQTEKEAYTLKHSKILEDSEQTNDLRECFLLKQIELLSNRIEELYERGISHDSELDASRKMYEEQLRQMNETLKEMQPSRVISEELKTLNEQLAESRTNELTLRAELNSQKKAHESIIVSLEEKLKLYTEKFSSLEQQYAEMVTEHETQSRDQSLTINNYNSTLSDLCKILKDLFDKITVLFVFLKNPILSGSDSNNSSLLSADLNLDKSLDGISDVFTKVNGAILELEEIKNLVVTVCRDNETLSLENNNLKDKVDENNQCLNSIETELVELNKKYNDEKLLRAELEEKCNILEKDKSTIQAELQQLDIRCQKLLSDKVSVEKKAAEFNEQYTSQMETIISQMNCWRNSQTFRLNGLEQSPTNESFNMNLIGNPKSCDLLHVATSTPYPTNIYDLLGTGESSKDSSQADYSNFALLKWMEKCQLLTQENSKLCNEVENLKSQINELEFGIQIVKEEMDIFEIKRLNLEMKISDYEEKKKKIIELKEENIRYLHEISNLKEEIETLTEKNDKLRQGNIKLEEKFQKYILPNSLIREQAKLDEKFINDFNEKIKEIISLKSNVMHLQENKDMLIKQLAKLNSSKNLYVIKLEQTFEQLCMKEDEMEDLLREKHQAQTENKLLTKEVEGLKLQYDRLLKKLRNNHWQMSDSPELLEHMQKVMLNLSKSLIESKLEINKLKLEKNNGMNVEELDARHRYEILLKSSETFRTEKDNLLQKITELQKLLHDFQPNQGFDKEWLLQLQQTEQELLDEMKEHRNQYARIEEALRSTGKLHDELQQQKDELRFKMIEIAKLEKKLQEEKSNLKRAELKNHDLLQLLEDKDNQLKNTIQEKNEVESNCKDLHKRFIELESKHATLEKTAEWRVARANLLLSQNEVDKEVVSLLEESKKFSKEEIDNNAKFRQHVELSYQKALNDLKSYFISEQASNSAKEKEEYKQQVDKLYDTIKQQSLKIEKLMLNTIERKLLPSDTIVGDNTSFKDLLDSLEKQKNDINSLCADFSEHEIIIFKNIQSLIQKYYKTQLSLSLKALQEEHFKQYEFSISTLKQLNREELQLALLQNEADRHCEKRTGEFNPCTAQLSKSEKDKYNEATGILTADIWCDNRNKSMLEELKFILLNDYFKKIEAFFVNWNPLYKEKLKNLRNDLKNGILEYDNQSKDNNSLFKISRNIDNIIHDQKELINSFNEVIKSLKEEKNIMIQKLDEFVEEFNSKTSEIIEDLNKSQLSPNNLLNLQDEVDKLKIERDELEKQYNSAILLLKSDHESEVKKAQILLDEFKQYCEAGCDVNTLMNLRIELEEKHKLEVEELRTYFEQKCADMEKHYSEEIFSQHSRKHSASSSSSEEDLTSERIYTDVGASGDNFASELMFATEENVDLLQYTPQKTNKIFQVNSEEPNEDKELSLDSLKRSYLAEITNLNKSWSLNLERLRNDLEKKYSTKILLLKEQLSPFLLKTSTGTVEKSVMTSMDKEMLSSENCNQNKICFLKESSCQCDFFDLDENQFDFNLQLEEMCLDQIACSLTDATIQKVDCEFAIKSLQTLATIVEERITNLIKSFESQFLKAEDELLSMSCKFNGICNNIENMLYKNSKNNNEIETLKSELIQLKRNMKNMKEFIVQEVIENIKTLLCDDEKQIDCDYAQEISDLNKLIIDKYDHVLSKLKEDHLKQIELIKENYAAKEMEMDCKQTHLVPTGIIEVDNVLKERENLKQVHINLKKAVEQLSSYINSSEDELIKTIAHELIKICHESSTLPTNYENLDDNSGDITVTPLKTKIVRFAPNILNVIKELDESSLTDSFDRTLDTSDSFRAELVSCLCKLKTEAATLLGISTSLNPEGEMDDKQLTRELMALQTEKEELLETVEELRQRLEAYQELVTNNETSFLTGNLRNQEINEEYTSHLQDFGESQTYRGNTTSFILDKVRHMFLGKEHVSPSMLKIVEEIAKDADNLIEELQRERDDLQQQIDAADKQLKSTRQFLEEQAAERESERDEYSKEVSTLQAQLKERGKEQSSRERYTTEVLPLGLHRVAVPRRKTVEELGEELKETAAKLAESESQKMKVESELKIAVDKVWVLREIISELEAQVTLKTDKELILEKKVEELEAELEQQNGAQCAMAEELESMRNQSLNDNCLDQMQELQDTIKLKFNSSVIRQFRVQIKEMEKTLDQLTKDLECLHVATSCNSLSSPSEEISLREHLESFRSKTPEHCPSPVALPIDEVKKLSEKLQRHARAQEVVIKKVKDQDIRITNLSHFIEELQQEREVLQQQIGKQMEQLAQANNKVDYLRHKADSAHVSANRDLIQKNQELKEKLKNAEESLECFNNQLTEKEAQLARAEQILTEQNIKLRNINACDHEVVDSLRIQLASVISEKNKLEEELDKWKREVNMDVIDVILADKNEDIQHLQQTVTLLQSQVDDKQIDDRSYSKNSKGHRVSFAADVSNSTFFSEEDYKLRDAPLQESLEILPPNISEEKLASFSDSSNDEVLPEPVLVSLTNIDPCEESNIELNLRSEIDSLKLELSEKSQQISILENKLSDLQNMEEDLQSTKSELEAVLASVTEDKQYYEEKLITMSNNLTKKDEEVTYLNNLIIHKDAEILKTSADVKALQQILSNLQEKLKEAQSLLDKENSTEIKQEVMHLRVENVRLKSVENQKKALETNVKLLEDQKKLLESSLESCDTFKQSMETKVKGLENDRVRLENKVANLESKKDSLECCIKTMEKDKDILEVAFEDLKASKELINEDLIQLKILLENEKRKYLNLEEEINKLTNENKITKEQFGELKSQHNDLKKEAKNYESELNEYVSCIRSMKNVIMSHNRRKSFGDHADAFSNSEIDKNDKAFVEREFSKLFSLMGEMDLERKKNIKELQELKNVYNEDILFTNQSEIKQLQSEITRLQSVIMQVKLENKERIKSMETEIITLEEDVKNFRKAELETTERLKKEILEKQLLNEKLEYMRRNTELFTASAVGVENKTPIKFKCPLTISDVSIIEVLPDAQSQGVDDLAEKLKMEAHLSAHLDKAILRNFIEEQSTSDTEIEIPFQERKCKCKSYYSPLVKKITALESILIKEMDINKDLRNRLAAEENHSHELTALKFKLQNELHKQERFLHIKDKQLEQLSAQLEEDKTKVLRLELGISTEKALHKQLEKQLEEEKRKNLASRREDILHLEDMRNRLQLLRENEGKLKALVIEKQERCLNLEAELNSLKALERYHSDSENDSVSQLKKEIIEQKEIVVQMMGELVNEREIRKDLQNTLLKERNVLANVNSLLKEEGRKRVCYEKEICKLRAENADTIHQKELIENRLASLLQSGSSSQERLIERNRNAVEAAHLVIKDLEEECAELKERLKHVEQQEDGLSGDVYLELLQQINHLSSNVDTLLKERTSLRKAVEDLKVQRNMLHEEVESLKKASRDNNRDSLSLRCPNFQLNAPVNLYAAPSCDEDIYDKFEKFVSNSLRAESHRKALVWQKRYLMVALRGYDDSLKKTVAVLGNLSNRRRRQTKLTFRSVSLAIFAAIRMSILIKHRRRRRHAVFVDILQTFGVKTIRHFEAQEFPAQTYPTRQNLHSPPSRDSHFRIPNLDSVVSSDYLSQLNELRGRLREISKNTKC